MENKNIIVDATVTAFPTIPSYGELETRITKMNSIIQSGTLDGKDLAYKYLKACNSTCDEEGLKAAIERLCSMGEAEAFEAYLANNTYTTPTPRRTPKPACMRWLHPLARSFPLSHWKTPTSSLMAAS